jgi:putative transposase
VHLTLRAVRGLPSLRKPGLFQVVKTSIARSSRSDFRIVHFSVQGDHLHLMVEADDKASLRAGASGLSIRTALALNKALGRSGHVWGDRYHTRDLRTPREVRNGLVYVLMNIRKHHPGPWDGLDPCSSALWFDGFRDRAGPTSLAPPVQASRTWLATRGWRRHGLISTFESPRSPS